MQQVFDLVERVADTDSTVLVTGESGTGKELVAREIHQRGSRENGPFLSINCGAMPAELLESELFGHVKGAFTGAVASKVGLFEAASGGILFLDEVEAMPEAMQVKLLRVLQDGRVRPVGGTQEVPTDARIVAATNRDLEVSMRRGAFREDLYYRLSVIPIHLPSLRERREDIPALVDHFLGKYSAKMDRSVRGMTSDAMRLLESHHWPGNVRELENVIERAVAVAADGSDIIEAEALPDRLRSGIRASGRSREGGPESIEELAEIFFDLRGQTGVAADKFLDLLRKRLVEEALERAGGQKARAAELLGISFRSFRYLVRKYAEEDG
jgi:transcriptional regulator with PAS, ATPase and Fis domain